MIQAALEYLVGLQRKEQQRVFVDSLGRERIWTGEGYDNLCDPQLNALSLSSLTSIISWFKSDPDAVKELAPYIHILGPGKVHITFPPDKKWMDRLTPAIATTDKLEVCQFNFGKPYSPENFIVDIQKYFVETEVKAQLIHIVGNISSDEVIAADDDGVSQTVVTRVSASFKGQAKLPNPLVLKPFRTFLEIDQPESKFVLRASKVSGSLPNLTLHLADGGQWKLAAMTSIKEFLEKELPDVTILA